MNKDFAKTQSVRLLENLWASRGLHVKNAPLSWEKFQIEEKGKFGNYNAF